MSRIVTLAGYVIVLAIAVAYQVRGMRTGRNATLSDLLDAVTGRAVLRWTLLAVWLWWGWHVFVRVSL